MRYYLIVLRRYAHVKGRASRAEFWNFMLFNYFVSVAIALIDKNLHSSTFGILYLWATFLPSMAVGMRRMHDSERYGWYILIPVYGLILACLAGTKGQNQYGPAPKPAARWQADK